MPTLRLTPAEATALKRKRARDKAHNATVGMCVDKVKARLKGADPLAGATLTSVLHDLRKLIR
jgi:hypothetical protein